LAAKDIMSLVPLTLRPQDTVAQAVRLMCDNNVHNIPVVDEAGCYIGLFTLRRLTHELLPTAARLDQHSLLMQIGFLLDEDQTHLIERIREIGRQSVKDVLETDERLQLCGPDTPIPQLVQMLFESPVSLPVVVVEGKGHRLVGMVSHWDVLNRVIARLLDEQAEPS
jgi:CBS-domain-containing membrane protein